MDTGETVAIKVVEKTRVSRFRTAKRLHNELRLTALVSSPNVARLLEAVQTPERLYLVLEHGGQDLFAYLSKGKGPPAAAGGDVDVRLDEEAARPLIAQIVAGVRALAAAGVVHFDIKTENILVELGADGEPYRLRLTDLGLAERYQPGERASVLCGSPGFFAPEMATAPHYDPFKVDQRGAV